MHKVFFKKGRTVAAQFIHLPARPAPPHQLYARPASCPTGPTNVQISRLAAICQSQSRTEREGDEECEIERAHLLFALINVDRFIIIIIIVIIVSKGAQ